MRVPLGLWFCAMVWRRHAEDVLKSVSFVLGVGLAATIAQACAGTTAQPTHSARSDCADAERPTMPDGKSVLTCERGASGFRWVASRAPADLATCPGNDVLALGCTRGERGLVCIRTADGDGGYAGSAWTPVCR